MAADGMSMNVPRIDFEVGPVKKERLTQPQDGFSKESIEAIIRPVLEEQSNYGVPENECCEGIGSFCLVFDVDSREKIQPILMSGRKFGGFYLDDSLPDRDRED